MKKHTLIVLTLMFVGGCSTVPAPSACDKNQNASVENYQSGVYQKVNYIVPCDKPQSINI